MKPVSCLRNMVLSVALLAVSAVPARLQAQTYARTVWEQLDRAYTSSQSSGYSTRNYILGRLDQGDTDTWTLLLYEGNEYKVVGACDGDCRDVDLFVETEGGSTVASDESRTDTPEVNVKVNTTGTFKVKVKMYDCKENPCYFGIGIFFKRA
jgi:hypothetical protein